MRISLALAFASLFALTGCEDMSDEDFDALAGAMQTVASANGGGYSAPAPSNDPDSVMTRALVQGTVNAAVSDGDSGEAFVNGVAQSLQNSNGGGNTVLATGAPAPIMPGGGEIPAGHPNMAAQACPGFTEENYRSRALQGGNDTQLYTLCGAAYEYYTMYKRALRQGYTAEQAEVTYQAHRKAALVVTQFVQDAR